MASRSPRIASRFIACSPSETPRGRTTGRRSLGQPFGITVAPLQQLDLRAADNAVGRLGDIAWHVVRYELRPHDHELHPRPGHLPNHQRAALDIPLERRAMLQA